LKNKDKIIEIKVKGAFFATRKIQALRSNGKASKINKVDIELKDWCE